MKNEQCFICNQKVDSTLGRWFRYIETNTEFRVEEPTIEQPLLKTDCKAFVCFQCDRNGQERR